MTFKRIALFFVFVAITLTAQTPNNSGISAQGGTTFDFSSAAHVDIPSFLFANFPVSCTATKDYINRTNPASAGQSLYVCNAAGNGFDLVGGAGGGGGGITVGAISALPGTCAVGTEYVATDSLVDERIICTTLNTFTYYARGRQIFPITSQTGWSNLNAYAGVTTDTAHGTSALIAPVAASLNYTGRVINVPAAPYTITATVRMSIPNINVAMGGIWLVDAGSGHQLHFEVLMSGITQTCALGGGTCIATLIREQETNSSTSDQTSVKTASFQWPSTNQEITLQIVQGAGGGNRVYNYSYDGVNFIQFNSEPAATWITATAAGFEVQNFGASGGSTNTANAQLTVVSWQMQ